MGRVARMCSGNDGHACRERGLEGTRAESKGGSAGVGGNRESMSSLATVSLLAVGTGLDVGEER